MKFEMSDKAQTIKIYNLRADTHEFIGAGDAYIPPHTGLPANCTVIAPPEAKDGYVAIFVDEENGWSYVEDHREMTVYDITDGRAIFISELGALPDNVTAIAPDGEFQVWNGNKWVKDEAAELQALIDDAKSTKNSLMTEANRQITPLQDAVELSIATEEEKSKLLEWKKYRVLLHRVDVTAAPHIEWPEIPA